jgi:hypothetical protein
MTNPLPKVSNPNPWPPSKILATFEGGQGFIEGGQTTEVDTFRIPPTMTQHQQMIYFARTPGSDEWVEFRDPPIATREALWGRGGSTDEGYSEEDVPF